MYPIEHFVRFGDFLGLDPSPLFDSAFYRRRNPDVDFTRIGAVAHFLLRGGHEGRDPNPLFDTRYYLAHCPDIGGRQIPLLHYLKHGAANGLSPSPYLDIAYYTSQHPEAAERLATPLEHFLGAGLAQGGQPNRLFDIKYYLDRYPEVRASGLHPIEHYAAIGAAKGYKTSPYFDSAFYLERYPEVRDSGTTALAHYLHHGRAEGRWPNPLFDPQFYLQTHADVRAAGFDALTHFLEYGAAERRRTHPDFDPEHYLARHADLVAGGCEPLAHFLDHGAVEGRQPNAWFDAAAYRQQHPEARLPGEAPFLHFLRNRSAANAAPVASCRAAGLLDLPWRYEGPARLPGRAHFRLLFVVHRANRTGAPLCALRLLEQLVRCPDLDCRVVVSYEGELVPCFAALAPTLRLGDAGTDIAGLARLFRDAATRCVAVVCGAPGADPAEAFDRCNVPVLAWVQELPGSIDAFYGGMRAVAQIDSAARVILSPSDASVDALVTAYGLNREKLRRLHNGTHGPPPEAEAAAMRDAVRVELGLPDEARIVLGCGTVDARKGSDLFLRAAHALVGASPGRSADLWFVWVGEAWDGQFMHWLAHDADALGIADRVIFTGQRADPAPYYAAADLFLLTSREDPFPGVCLEALSHGLPVIAFAGAGGAPEALAEGRGIVVPYLDVPAMAEAARRVLSDLPAARARGRETRKTIATEFGWARYAERFLGLLGEAFGFVAARPLTVSVIVPNYNHAGFLRQRLDSILAQSRLPDEIVFLDDASTDDSVAVAREYAARSPVAFRIVVNDRNGGSAFDQWEKGLSLVSGDLVWIAESDDWCTPDFLERLIPEFYDDAVQLAFSQSAIVGARGELLAPDYLAYTDSLSTTHWRSGYSIAGEEEIRLALAHKNTIPNASAVLLRRSALDGLRGRLAQYRLCGDWWLYSQVIRHGRISFIAQALNYHRRHERTVTENMEREDRAIAEALAVKEAIFAALPLPADVKYRSIAQTVCEYHRLSERHGLERPDLLDNPLLAEPLERLRSAIPGAEGGLRILTILPDLDIGGGQIAGIRLANAIARKHRSFLLNARPDRCDPDLAARVDDAVILLEGTLGPSEWSLHRDAGPNPDQLAEGRERIRVLRELIRFHRIDAIISHVWWADRLAHAVVEGLGVPWFIHMHGSYEGLIETETWDEALAGMVRGMLRRLAGVFYLTPRNLAIFDHLGIDKPPVTARLVNSVDPIEVPQGRSRQRTDAQSFTFCLCSRAIPEKGWSEAIEAVVSINALPASSRGGRRARLRLLGGGPHAETLAAAHAEVEEVEFLGSVARVMDVMIECDAGLLPSRFMSESMPCSLIECLACGIPVVATNNGAIAEMVTCDGRDAGLVLPLDGNRSFKIADLANLMLRYMTDPALYEGHRRNARYVFDRLFDATTQTERCLGVVAATVARREAEAAAAGFAGETGAPRAIVGFPASPLPGPEGRRAVVGFEANPPPRPESGRAAPAAR